MIMAPVSNQGMVVPKRMVFLIVSALKEHSF